MTYNVFGGTLNLAQSNPIPICIVYVSHKATMKTDGITQCLKLSLAQLRTVVLTAGIAHVTTFVLALVSTCCHCIKITTRLGFESLSLVKTSKS